MLVFGIVWAEIFSDSGSLHFLMFRIGKFEMCYLCKVQQRFFFEIALLSDIWIFSIALQLVTARLIAIFLHGGTDWLTKDEVSTYIE